MTTEELIRETVSKICPFHGKKAAVKIQGTGQIEISACCKEFRKFLEAHIKHKFQKGVSITGSSEITSDG